MLFIHVAELQTKSVNAKKSHRLLQMIRLSCFKNYKVICSLSETVIYNECKVYKFELISYTVSYIKNPSVAVKMSPLVLALIKHLSGLFSESPLNTDTRIIRGTAACPLGPLTRFHCTIFDRQGTPFVYLPWKMVPLLYTYEATFANFFPSETLKILG